MLSQDIKGAPDVHEDVFMSGPRDDRLGIHYTAKAKGWLKI